MTFLVIPSIDAHNDPWIKVFSFFSIKPKNEIMLEVDGKHTSGGGNPGADSRNHREG
jgi:hypothetical protein